MSPERIRMRILAALPRPFIEEPFEAFICGLCLVSGLPLCLGQATPQSIEALMPPWFARSWGFALTLGAFLVTAGLIKTTRQSRPVGIRPYGRTLEHLGLIILGYASAIYALAIVGVAGLRGLVPAVIVFGFCLTCAVRAFVIGTARVVAARLHQDQKRGE